MPSISLFPRRSKRLIIFLLLAVFCFLGVYTWNWRTGALDTFAERSGMEIVIWTGTPLLWAREKIQGVWKRYIYLVALRQENDRLRAKVTDLHLQLSRLHEDAAEVSRLRALHSFQPPEEWRIEGGRVVSYRFGPHAVVESMLVDKGIAANVHTNTPVITSQGVVGRVLRSSANLSQVLMITDPNSRISAIGRDNRTQGILVGQGPGDFLHMLYVPLNDILEEGEVLVTSGLDGIFPKGLPLARVERIIRSSVSLFQTVYAVPLADLRNLEEVLLVSNVSQPVVE